VFVAKATPPATELYQLTCNPTPGAFTVKVGIGSPKQIIELFGLTAGEIGDPELSHEHVPALKTKVSQQLTIGG
jgi:hypothetical protein